MGASCSWCSTIVKTNVAALLLLPLRLLQPVRASVLRRGEGGGQREARLRVGKNYKTECRSRGCTQGSGAHGMWTHGGRGVGAGRRPLVLVTEVSHATFWRLQPAKACHARCQVPLCTPVAAVAVCCMAGEVMASRYQA